MKLHPLILAIDDDPDFLDFLEAVLKEENHRVVRAKNAKEAFKILRAITPHLILLDIHMPDMDGYTLYKEIQKWHRLASVPLIFITGKDSKQDKQYALTMGAADFLSKPLDPELLKQKVKQHLKTYERWQEIQQILSRLKHPETKTRFSQNTIFAFQRFREYLLNRGLIPEDKISEFLQIDPKKLYDFARELGISEDEIASSIATFLNVPFLLHFDPEKIQLDVFPKAFCEHYLVLGIQEKEKQGYIVANPFDFELMEILNLQSEGKVQLFIAPPHLIQKALLGELKEEPLLEKQWVNQYLEETKEEEENLEEEISSPLILFVNKVIEDAYKAGASDIHIEPWEEEVVIRYRIDGVLRIVNRIQPRNIIRPIAARIKIMARLNIAERRLPQDGRIAFKHFNHKGLDFDLRVSTAPMNYGEKIVLRILDKQKSVWPLEKLGFSKHHLQLYREQIRSPYGIILHVGPTGSGKSMTLYAALKEISRPEINIQTIEDPIEYTLPGINQLQVNPEVGLTFASALRSFLRQDPDVILVGEIRDRETAEIAIQASLTGHLVFSTLHTNDAPSTITRLTDMGIEPFLVSATLVLVCAQRLIRRLCPHCKVQYKTSESEMALLEVDHPLHLFRAKGCEKCQGLGYKGRIGVHEILVPNEKFRNAISQGGISSDQLKKLALEELGMTTLFWDGVDKVLDGISSLEEVRSRIRKDNIPSCPTWMKEKLKKFSRPLSSHLEEKLKKLQKEYFQKLRQKIEQLEKLWTEWREKKGENSLQELYTQFHKLAGSAGSYGFSTLSEMAKKGEKILEEGLQSPKQIDILLRQMKEWWKKEKEKFF